VPWLRRLTAGLPPRRPGFDPGSVYVGFVVDKVALGRVFPPSTSVFPCQFHFHFCSITRKRTKNNHHRHLHHRVAQEASRLRCVRSVCCGALHQLKKESLNSPLLLFSGRNKYKPMGKRDTSCILQIKCNTVLMTL
jgi:hypothetical protein